MNAYLVIGGYRVHVVKDTYRPGSDTPLEVEDTLDGSSFKQFGVSKDVWSATLLVPYGNPPVNYASYPIVKAWFKANTAAGNVLAFQDFDYPTQPQINVHVINQFEPIPQGPIFYDPATLWEIPIKLREKK